MERRISRSLDAWLDESGRRPLVLRGARQVGKTWLVRNLAARAGRSLIEINFERDPGRRRFFASNEPLRIVGELSLLLGREIDPGRSLLFLDEVQAAVDVLPKLRWFHEELPALPVVAAGSLLEFALTEHPFSMPVGRVAYRHVEPMDFPEFLLAHGQERLLGVIEAWRPGHTLSLAAHESATTWFQRYAMVGGMPAVVAADVAGQGPRACRELQRDLIATYRDDFAKYQGRMDRDILDSVLLSVAGAVGRKFVYAHVDDSVKAHQAKRSLERLAAARLCHLVRYSAARTPPLGAEVKDTFRKAVLLDAGLLHALVGTPATEAFPSWESLSRSFRGQLADQLAAQQLRLTQERSGDAPELYYWQREGGRPGEIDYLVQLEGQVVPIELKSGAIGAMKSLHQFMADKRLPLAVRCDANPPILMRVAVRTTRGEPVEYELLSVPLYLLGNLAEILASLRREGGRTLMK